MILLKTHLEGFDGWADDLVIETKKDLRKPARKLGTLIVQLMRRKLSARGGPSLPGHPPARVTGALRSTVGRGPAQMTKEGVKIAAGIGVGRVAARKADALKAQGINVFQYAKLHEVGGIGADGRRYPARPYARPAEQEIEARIDSLVEIDL